MDERTKSAVLTMSFAVPTNVYTGLDQIFVVTYIDSVAAAVQKHLLPDDTVADIARSMCFTGREGWLKEMRRQGYRILNVCSTGIAAVEVSRGRFYTYNCEQLCLSEPFHVVDDGVLRINGDGSAIFWGRTKIGDGAGTEIALDKHEIDFLVGKRVMFVSEVRKADRTYHVIETTSEVDQSADEKYSDVKRELALRVNQAKPDVTDLVESDQHLSLLASNLMGSKLGRRVKEIDLPFLLGIVNCESKGHISDFNLRVLADRVGSAQAPGKLRYASIGSIAARVYDLSKVQYRTETWAIISGMHGCECETLPFVGPLRRVEGTRPRRGSSRLAGSFADVAESWSIFRFLHPRHCRLISFSSREVCVGGAVPAWTIAAAMIGIAVFGIATFLVANYKRDSAVEVGALSITIVVGTPLLVHRIAYKGWAISDAVRFKVASDSSDVIEAAIGRGRMLSVLNQVQNPEQLFDGVNSCAFVQEGKGSFSIAQPFSFQEMQALGMSFVITPDLQEAVRNKGAVRRLRVHQGLSHVAETLSFQYGIPSKRGSHDGVAGNPVHLSV